MSKAILKYKRISLIVTISLFVFGLYSALSMPKSEDPEIAPTAGMITVIYPGATPQEMLNYIAEPLEDELSEVELIQDIDTTIRSEVVLIKISLNEKLDDSAVLTETWDEVRRAMNKAQNEFPAGVFEVSLKDDLMDKEAIVYGLTSDRPLIALRKEVEKIKSDLLKLEHVKRVNINSDPDEQISIYVKDSLLPELGISYFDIVGQIKKSNANVPAGSVEYKNRMVSLRANTTFKSLEEIKDFPIILKSGSVVRLETLADIEKTIAIPKRNAMLLDGKEAIGLGIVLSKNIDLIQYGDYFDAEISKIKAKYPQVNFTRISYFPDNVKNRIFDLNNSLIVGVLSLGLVLILLMGIRVGLLVSIIVPVITFISLGFFAASGGVLQQISISAFVMAIGLLVDNVIVISESIQSKITAGMSREKAATSTISEFALPLFAATGTTIASFLPMMIAEGPAAQFTRSLATVTAITLTVSYILSVFVTPIVAGRFLKKATTKSSELANKVYSFLSTFVYKRSLLIVFGVTGFIFLGMMSLGSLKKQFFPYADRDQLVVDLRLPEGTHFSKTEQLSAKLVQQIETSRLWKKEVTQVSTYVGSSTPKFFYNLNLLPNAPHIAQMIVRVQDFSIAPKVRDDLERLLTPLVPDGVLMVRELEQGPPVEAAVEVKVFGDNLEERTRVTYAITKLLNDMKETKAVRHNLGQGTREYYFKVDDANANRYNLSRNAVTSVLLGRTRGLPAGQFRVNKDPVPILVKSKKGEGYTRSELNNAYVMSTRNKELLVRDLSSNAISWQPSSMQRENGKAVTSIYSEVEKGYGYNDILAKLNEQLPEVKAQVPVVIGGQGAESGKSNGELMKNAPFAFVTLLIFLMIQFNSFRKFFIVFSAVPLAFIGLGPSHLFFGFPFGFFSLLGALALIGIIVNNAILLIEFLDMKAEESLLSALEDTFRARLRPIFLTTLTTIIGLLPLAFSKATLWPPFAWTIIFGLFLGSVLTVFFVPALYVLIFKKSHVKMPANLAPATMVIALLVGPLFSDAQAETLSLKEALVLSQDAPQVEKMRMNLLNVQTKEDIDFNATFLPALGLNIERESFNETQNLTTPIGDLPFFPQNRTVGGAVLNQRILDVSKMVYQTKANQQATKSMEKNLKWFKEIYQYKVGMLYLENVKNYIKADSLRELLDSLKRRRKEILRLVKLGRASKVDELKIDSKIIDLEQALSELEAILPSLDSTLGRVLGKDENIRVRPYKKMIADLEKKKQAKNTMAFDPSQRSDIQALKYDMASLDAKVKMTDATYLPTVDLELRGFYQDPSQFQRDAWYSGAVVLKWDIFKRGTRAGQKKVMRNQLGQLQIDQTETIRKIRIQRSKVLNMLTKLRSEVRVRRANLEKVRIARKIENKRYLDGKSSLNDLVDAEELLKDSREKSKTSFINYHQYLLEFHFIEERMAEYI